MTFLNPSALYLLIIVPLYIALHSYFEKRRQKDLIPFGNFEILQDALLKTKKIDFLVYLPITLKILILILLILCLARPQAKILQSVKDAKIILLMDNSISMEATDVEPTRCDVARETAIKFVKDLPKGVKIGIGFFSANVRIIVNPTDQKHEITNTLNNFTLSILEPGTAIGDALKSGVESLLIGSDQKQSQKDNKTIILITDGEVNFGIDPIYAAKLAKEKNITVQSIGIGNPSGTIIRGGILTRLDEDSLKSISKITGGQYFNARSLNDMNQIYQKIKQTIHLEQSEQEITYLLVGCIFILICILQALKWTKFRFV